MYSMAECLAQPSVADTFTYDSTLRSSEFRLIKILAAEEENTSLELQIQTFSLEPPPHSYYALSYTWGAAEFDSEPTEDQADTYPIALNNRSFQVRQNLHDALFHLRTNLPDAWLWIDAICINQDDLRERAEQVSLMDVIYTNAVKTIAWLGKSSPGLPRAFQIMSQASRILRAAGLLIAVASEDLSLRLQERLGNWLSLEDWDYLSELFTRRWFSRLWIFQEVVLAREITISCGNTLIPWRVVADFAALAYHSGSMMQLFLQLEAMSRPNSPLECMRQSVANVALIEKARLVCGGRGIIKLSTQEYPFLGASFDLPNDSPEDFLILLMFSTPNTGMSDKRDRFYGLFGILKKFLKHVDIDVPWAKVDYEEPLADVYTRMTRAIILHDGRLDILCFAGKLLAKIEDVPSWVSEWNCAHFPGNYPTPLHRQDASKSLDMKTISLDIRGPRLHCRGLRIGPVIKLAEQPHGYLDFMNGDLRTLAAITTCLPLVYPYTNQPRVEAVCRTLLLDKYTTHTRTGDDPGGVFDGLRAPFKEWVMRAVAESEVGSFAAGKTWEAIMEEYRVFDEVASSDETGLFPSTQDLLERCEMLRKPDATGHVLELAAQRQIKLLEDWRQEAQKWLTRLVQPSLRRLAILGGRHLANLPDRADVEDEVWIVQGCHMPLLMRRSGDGESWVNMGAAFVHGIMSGEAITDYIRWEDICIV
ncbi:hypothetical protein CkaCkLH20_07102 [Colletotrichum karsti]|uniref:Heterokaryon incompatibility domain-containing protein n=1 Tax=Colletotrichum karsti TaxID=1095194 RepID=A0A9P6LK58_9PEZI|nr:uncharacterized protein CkaCkLH20_07102 [Colletotrichum karsti]KAF9875282.1 hypothetical protein CkaCkLH20_07102 [Colletotrichum karsti]